MFGLGFIGSCISAACSFVGSCVSKLGSAIVKGAQVLARGIQSLASKINEHIIKVAEGIARIAKSIAVFFGDVKEEDDIEQIGAKAMQDGTKNRDEFKDTSEYIEYLRNEVKLDKEKFESRKESDRLAYFSVGAELCRKNVEEKTGLKVPAEFLLMAKQIDMKHDQINQCILSFKERGMNDVGDMVRYLKGEGGKLDRVAVKDSMVDGLSKTSDNLNIEDALEIISGWKEDLRENRNE